MLAEKLSGAAARALTEAYEQVEDEEDEHLYHTKGWCRELWLEALGLPAQLPPPEEERDVKTAVEAAQVEKERKGEVKRGSNGKGKRPQPRA